MESKTKIQLRYADTDQMGVIHHSRYFQYFELSRLDLLKLMGFDYYKIEASGLMMQIRDVQCTYIRSISAEEDVYVVTKVDQFTKYQIKFYHEIINANDELKCKGYTTIVTVDKQTFKPKRMDVVLPYLYKQL